MLSQKIIDSYTAVLKAELRPAMGCTEPIAIAYASAIVTDALGGAPEKITVELSGNIIKNVKSVVVPATGGMHGIESAVAAGVIAAAPQKKLEVLSVLGEGDCERILEYKRKCDIKVSELNSPCTFDLYISAELGEHTACVRITGGHTDIVSVKLDGASILSRYASDSVALDTSGERDVRDALLNVKDVITFAEEVDLSELRPYLEAQIDLNMAIAEEGLRNSYGASIGQLLLETTSRVDVIRKARAYAAAGSDARMSGCEKAVCIISGSGNQGITASVPVIVYAREYEIDHETLLRALIVSDLITVHQKTGIGCLSAYCGAISAGCGCGAGISYLLGGRYHEIAHTIVNAVAILSGTICDGAKPSCAAKIAMAVEAGIMGYEMARTNRQFYGGDGIVTKGVENTIKNVGRLARDGMGETDKEIIRIMLGED